MDLGVSSSPQQPQIHVLSAILVLTCQPQTQHRSFFLPHLNGRALELHSTERPTGIQPQLVLIHIP